MELITCQQLKHLQKLNQFNQNMNNFRKKISKIKLKLYNNYLKVSQLILKNV